MKFKQIFILLFILILFMVYFDTVYPKVFYEKIESSDSIIVYKGKRILSLFNNGRLIKSYPISLGSDAFGHKEQEGDGRTPEGVYLIDWLHPNSSYHKAIRISYPNSIDKNSARKRGVKPGSDIMIHGLPNGLGWLYPLLSKIDWTEGCIAVSNVAIEEIASSVSIGSTITIEP